MPSVIYDASKTPADILIDYTSHLRCEVESMTDIELTELIMKLETCVDESHCANRQQAVHRLTEICRNELDDRDLVRCLVREGLITGVSFIEEDGNE